MDNLLFPNWMLFSGFYLFLKIYNPTRLYLDNTICLAIAMVLTIMLDNTDLTFHASIYWVVGIVFFAFFSSVPYFLGGMLGSIVQQLLLLNEQSVQDRRFTDETEALSKISSLVFVLFSLKEGYLFRPLLDVINNTNVSEMNFQQLYFFIIDSLKMMAVVSSKYIIVLLIISIATAYLDLFFKKASLSMWVAPNLKAIAVILLLNVWLLNDQLYIFQQMMKKVGYYE